VKSDVLPDKYFFMSRENFNQTWLTEMPQGLGSFETFDAIEYHIRDLFRNGIKPSDLGNGLKKVELSQTMYYWYQDHTGAISLGVSLNKEPQGLVVSLTGKNPALKNRPPFASDLYNTILADNKTSSIRLLSDESLSDEGKALWDRLFKQGHAVSIYDREQPGKTFKTFKSQQ
jgi:hypothetical protein